ALLAQNRWSPVFQIPPLERDIVVEVTGWWSCRRLGSAATAFAEAATAAPRATTATRPATSTAFAPAPAAPEHLHLAADDLGRVAVAALFVLPLARAQAAFDVDLRALAQVLGG